MNPAEIVGLLADSDRRRVVAAMILGASTSTDIARTAGLDARAVAIALHRLTERGLVIRDGEHVFVVEEAFAVAARAAAAEPEPLDPDLDPEVARVMRSFVRDGRITQIPMQHAKRRVLLEWLVQDFEPGRRYSEKMVNLVLGKRHPDTAALRRGLVDEELMSREAGEYWRTGGPVEVD
ncbi:MAG: DUF2087 domain-containing protein [Acidimicrobiia bacterium]